MLKAEKEKTEKLEKKKAEKWEELEKLEEKSKEAKESQESEEGLHSSARILDGRLARKKAGLSRKQFLRQADAALVAQARQLPQSVLALLR